MTWGQQCRHFTKKLLFYIAQVPAYSGQKNEKLWTKIITYLKDWKKIVENFSSFSSCLIEILHIEKRNSFSKASFNYTFFTFQLIVARESVSWSWTTTRIQASLIEFLPRRETVSKRIYSCHQIGSASLKFKHFDWVIVKLVFILANQMTPIWKISFGKLHLTKSICKWIYP